MPLSWEKIEDFECFPISTEVHLIAISLNWRSKHFTNNRTVITKNSKHFKVQHMS